MKLKGVADWAREEWVSDVGSESMKQVDPFQPAKTFDEIPLI